MSYIQSAQSGGGGEGTVTSVALTMPGVFSVAGSPVTTSGTLAVSLATETANTVWAGPTSGGAATPTFRALVTSDLPAGTGDVVGPSSATDNAITRFDLTTGKLIQNSGLNIGDLTSNKINFGSPASAATSTALEITAGANSASAVGGNLRLGGGAGGTGAEKGAVVILGTANTTGNRPLLVTETDGCGEFGYDYNAGAYRRFRAGFFKTSIEIRDGGGSGAGVLITNDATDSSVRLFRSTAGHGIRLVNSGNIVLQIQDESANVLHQFNNGNAIFGVNTSNVVRFNNATQSTVGSAGGASAVPATPTGYWEVNLNGTAYVVPYYAKS